MKKIFLSLLAVAALASCTKSEVLYEAPQEIGFRAVAGNITKAVVDGTTYPTDLHMYVYAQTVDITNGTANYINNGEFKYNKTSDGKKLWAGWNGSAHAPYYWPNVHKLNFAGYSKSGNVNTDNPATTDVVEGATVTYSFLDDSGLEITNYTPGSNDNDLMWFGNTAKTANGALGYGKETLFVPATMNHTCSWITFLIKGDAGTLGYTITEMKITGIDNCADVLCYNVKQDGHDLIEWTNNEEQGPQDNGTYSAANIYNISIASSLTLTTDAKNVETGVRDDATTANINESLAGGNLVVIPQVPGNISITYQSTNNQVAPETVSASLALAKNDDDTVGPTKWEPGKHYIYTITIKANEILIAPTPVDWTDGNWNITIE